MKLRHKPTRLPTNAMINYGTHVYQPLACHGQPKKKEEGTPSDPPLQRPLAFVGPDQYIWESNPNPVAEVEQVTYIHSSTKSVQDFAALQVQNVTMRRFYWQIS
jgi:hypothetical protein